MVNGFEVVPIDSKQALDGTVNRENFRLAPWGRRTPPAVCEPEYRLIRGTQATAGLNLRPGRPFRRFATSRCEKCELETHRFAAEGWHAQFPSSWAVGMAISRSWSEGYPPPVLTVNSPLKILATLID